MWSRDISRAPIFHRSAGRTAIFRAVRVHRATHLRLVTRIVARVLLNARAEVLRNGTLEESA